MSDADDIRQLYQISGGPSRGYEVNRLTGRDHPTMTYYDEPCELIETVAHTTSSEAAFAVLRLHGVREYTDWRRIEGRPHPQWGQPLSRVPSRSEEK